MKRYNQQLIDPTNKFNTQSSQNVASGLKSLNKQQGLCSHPVSSSPHVCNCLTLARQQVNIATFEAEQWLISPSVLTSHYYNKSTIYR